MEVQQKPWVYLGDPDLVDLVVGKADLSCGGHLIAFLMADGAIRIGASIHPAQYINRLAVQLRQMGGTPIKSVMVSKPCLRHEAVRRKLVERLRNYHDSGANLFRLSGERFTEEAESILQFSQAM